jgi:hypothetical protein
MYIDDKENLAIAELLKRRQSRSCSYALGKYELRRSLYFSVIAKKTANGGVKMLILIFVYA